MLFIATTQCQDLFLVLKLWICKWDFYEDLCVILCFSWKLMPLSFPGDTMHIYHKPDTPTSSLIVKIGRRKLNRWWEKNVFKKQVGVKKGSWKRGRKTQLQLVPGPCSRKLTINYCWQEAQPFSRRPAGTRQSRAGLLPAPSQARASLPAAAPGQQTCSWPDTSPLKCCHLSAFIKARQSCCSSEKLSQQCNH